MIDLIKAVVVHVTQGAGIVTECDDTGIIKVAFKSGALTLKYPESFKDGLVYFDDPYIRTKMAIDFNQAIVAKEKRKWHFPRKHLVAAYVKERPSAPVQSPESITPVSNNGNRQPSVMGQKKRIRNRSFVSHGEYVYNPYDWDEKLARSCDTCFLYKSENCNGVRSAKTCEEYRPIPNITRAEQYLWPKH